MFRLSKKLLFAIEAVVDIAYHAGPGPVRSIDISRRQGIPTLRPQLATPSTPP